MLTLLAGLLFAQTPQTFALTEAGMTLRLGSAWHMSRWSDWDFKGNTTDNAVFLKAWYTPLQVAVDETAANGWAVQYRAKLEEEERAREVKMERIAVGEVSGRPTARVDMGFELPSGGKGTMQAAAFALDGKVMHLATYAAAAHATRATRELEAALAAMTVEKPASDLSTLGAIGDTGWKAGLPSGWRAPLASEAAEVEPMLSWVPDQGARDCAQAVSPSASGEPSLLLVCPHTDWHMPIVDESSFEDAAGTVGRLVYGKASQNLASPAKIRMDGRLGLLARPTLPDRDLRMGAAELDSGAILVWAVGPRGSAQALEGAVSATMSEMKFDAPPQHAAGVVVFHTLKYQPWHPLVLAPGLACLASMGGLLLFIFRRKAPEQVPAY
jgi:hypothetical protein